MLRAGAWHPEAGVEESGASVATAAERGPADVHQLYGALNEYLRLEHKFQPKLCLPNESESGEVTAGARDGAAHVLRSLKVWFDLPADVLLHAVNLFDRFLTKMKVRPCHVPCITVACMNIALQEHADNTKQPRTVAVEELVSVSQSACTAGDAVRMSRVIADKLALVPGSVTVTPLHWLRLLRRLVDTAVTAPSPATLECLATQESELVNLLEIVMCDAQCVNARGSELALVLLYHKLEQQFVEWSRQGATPIPEHAYHVFDLAVQLQAHCHMSDESLMSTAARVKSVISRYEARTGAPHRQRLVWRLSERTLKVLRPTDRLTSLLPTIEEQHFSADATPTRTRLVSESSESETSDWPRSPVLPVYCDN